MRCRIEKSWVASVLVLAHLVQGCTWTNEIPTSELAKLNGLRANARRVVRTKHGEDVEIAPDDEVTLTLTGNLHETHRFAAIDIDSETFTGVTQDGQKVRVPVSYIESISIEKFSGGKTAVEVVVLLVLAIPVLLVLFVLASLSRT